MNNPYGHYHRHPAHADALAHAPVRCERCRKEIR